MILFFLWRDKAYHFQQLASSTPQLRVSQLLSEFGLKVILPYTRRVIVNINVKIFVLIVMLCISMYTPSTTAQAGKYNANAVDDLYNFYAESRGVNWKNTDKYKGSWHANGIKEHYQNSLYKYSGPTSTYTAKHAPLAVEKGKFTYFIINGQQEEYPYTPRQAAASYNTSHKISPISMMVGKYDNVTGTLYPPTTVHVKSTTDSHDNASINVDSDGFLYVFVSGRSGVRGGLIYKSNSANSIESFKLVYSGKHSIETLDLDCDPNYAPNGWELCRNEYRGFTYPQAWWTGNKFVLLHTIYLPLTYDDPAANPSYMRATYISTVTPTSGGVTVSSPSKLVAVKGDYTKGHYSISKEKNGTIGLAFNLHVDDETTWKGKAVAPHDSRTNLYFMYSKNGNDWFNIKGEEVASGMLDRGTSNRGITKPSQLSSIAVKEYHNPVTGETNETTWCDDRHAVLGKSSPSKYVCRRVYLKDIDFTIDAQGKPNRVEILYVANRSVEYSTINNVSKEFGPYPSPEIAENDIYLARAFYNKDNALGWQTERVKDASGKDVVDHNYSSGTLTIVDGASYIITPASQERDGYAGQRQVKVLKNTTGAKGSWNEVYSKYSVPLTAGKTANYVRSVHNSTSKFRVLWSEGLADVDADGGEEVKVYLGDLTNKKLLLPNTGTLPINGKYVPFN
ncbi:hypothetical protein Sden_0039 [Shewanella denitrificans OS217]|uniref:Uncharacterized protein n=2 Tax=Shewanella TaxID=22 RepID=Q12T90_SHEDO|nr:hypothetical protein Sden_0039 [Shewanella denitrificans OS217]